MYLFTVTPFNARLLLKASTGEAPNWNRYQVNIQMIRSST